MFIMPSYMKGKSYRFTNEKWRFNILQLMLDSRKRDIHRSIALALENIIKDRDDFISTIKVFGHWKASGDTSKSSSLGLSIGRQFEELGLQNHAENIYREVLDMWKVKSNSDDEEVIAGKITLYCFKYSCVAFVRYNLSYVLPIFPVSRLQRVYSR